MATYFQNCTTFDELRQEYRRLCLTHHPDRGGDTRTMQDINAAHADATKRLASPEGWSKEAQHGKDWSEGRESYYTELSEKLRKVLYDLLSIPDIEIEITGYWFWIDHPDTRSIKEQLKANGCRWSRNKKRWYYPGVPSRGRGRSGMSEIRSNYGSERVRGRGENDSSAIGEGGR